MDSHARAADKVLREIGHTSLDGLPMALCGHSLGAYAVAAIAEKAYGLHHVLAVSPVVSGAALLAARARMGPPALDALAREAPRLRATMEASSAVPFLKTLAVPVAVMTGTLDGLTPPSDARAYFNAAVEGCFFAALFGEHHCPTGPVLNTALDAAFDAVDMPPLRRSRDASG